MLFLSYHTKINTEVTNFPRSCRNRVVGESHPRVPIVQNLSLGQPTVTMVTRVDDGVLPRTVVPPFSFQRRDSRAGCQPCAGSGMGSSTSPGPEHRLWPHCPGVGCHPAALGT